MTLDPNGLNDDVEAALKKPEKGWKKENVEKCK